MQTGWITWKTRNIRKKSEGTARICPENQNVKLITTCQFFLRYYPDRMGTPGAKRGAIFFPDRGFVPILPEQVCTEPAEIPVLPDRPEERSRIRMTTAH
jgi:hypothetical protein